MAGAKRSVQSAVFSVALSLAAVLLPSTSQAALTPEEATQVGGKLSETGARLAALQASAQKVAEAAPGTGAALSAALKQIANAPASRSVERQWALLALSLALIAGLALGASGTFAVWNRSRRTPDVISLGQPLNLHAGQHQPTPCGNSSACGTLTTTRQRALV